MIGKTLPFHSPMSDGGLPAKKATRGKRPSSSGFRKPPGFPHKPFFRILSQAFRLPAPVLSLMQPPVGTSLFPIEKRTKINIPL